MENTTYQQRLKELVQIIRTYGYRQLEGLTLDELTWRPEGTRARTIQSYLRHIVNAEVYWLKTLGDDTFDYLFKEASFTEIMDRYKQLEVHITGLIDIAAKDEIIPRKPAFKEDNLQKPGTLAWMVERTSLHAIHHFAQVAYIRYSLEKPPSSESIKWGEVMDFFIMLKEINPL
ncbi:MAG: DinB family protein [Candidatus Heimdallarchaeota archaeon]|nr:MAG: DinB family protein [Candidatus Heimdallarchaeota archaeon]